MPAYQIRCTQPGCGHPYDLNAVDDVGFVVCPACGTRAKLELVDIVVAEGEDAAGWDGTLICDRCKRLVFAEGRATTTFRVEVGSVVCQACDTSVPKALCECGAIDPGDAECAWNHAVGVTPRRQTGPGAKYPADRAPRGERFGTTSGSIPPPIHPTPGMAGPQTMDLLKPVFAEHRKAVDRAFDDAMSEETEDGIRGGQGREPEDLGISGTLAVIVLGALLAVGVVVGLGRAFGWIQ